MTVEFHIDYAPMSHLYAKEKIEGTLYLGFRDVPQLIERYVKQPPEHLVKALDFGCGTGVSTRYLQNLPLFPKGIEVCGVDISSDMLKRAQEADPNGTYALLQNGKIPFVDDSFDLVFSTFVLFEFATLDKMSEALQEIKRIMKPGALFIAVTGSAEGYERGLSWVSLNMNFDQNDNLQSGDLARVDCRMEDAILTFHNYYWKESDYCQVFEKVGLQLKTILHPLGREDEQLLWQWQSETKVSLYYIFALSKA